jgi:hypothetical protein
MRLALSIAIIAAALFSATGAEAQTRGQGAGPCPLKPVCRGGQISTCALLGTPESGCSCLRWRRCFGGSPRRPNSAIRRGPTGTPRQIAPSQRAPRPGQRDTDSYIVR